ncbi:hypothetical protein [Amycolatopsis sp. NPDC004378]
MAHSLGEGAPADVVGFLAAGFCSTAGEDRVRASLDAGRFYLRTTVEQDGTTLYRLLHQSLADYLRRYPMSVIAENDPDDAGSHAGVVFDRLLSAVRAGRWGRWSSVPPYLLRHAIHHAIEAARVDDLLFDIEFLLHADPASLTPELYRAKAVAAQQNAEVYFRALDHWAFRSGDPATRRRIFAVEAARHGAGALSGRIAAEFPAAGWSPRWGSGPALRRRIRLGYRRDGRAGSRVRHPRLRQHGAGLAACPGHRRTHRRSPRRGGRRRFRGRRHPHRRPTDGRDRPIGRHRAGLGPAHGRARRQFRRGRRLDQRHHVHRTGRTADRGRLRNEQRPVLGSRHR